MNKQSFFVFLILLAGFVGVVHGQPSKEFKGRTFGKAINTGADEFAPVLSTSGRKIFFVRAKPNNERGHDIWVTTKKRGKWMPPEKLGKSINGQGANGIGGLSYDRNTLYLTNIYDEFGNTIGTGISKAARKGFDWNAPEAIWDASNLPLTGSFGFHAVEGGQTFLLSMQDTTQGYGAEDLYVITMQDSAYSEPINLGENINTEGVELSPFVANNGKLLFFASNGHGGEGSVDIFMSRRTGPSWTDWSMPVNLGKEVNTPDFDAYFIMDTLSQTVVFSSAPNEGALGDLFITEAANIPALQDSLPRAELVELVDTVSEEPPVEEVAVEEVEEEPVALDTAVQDTAIAIAPVPPTIVAPAEEKVAEQVVYEEIYEEVVNKEDVAFDNVQFDFNKYKLRASEKKKVDRMVEFMKNHPEMRLKLNGHTDAIGSDSINVIFGNARCVSIQNYMSLKGIPLRRIEVYSYGEKEPLEGGPAANRRVEVFLIQPGNKED